jgi:copper chaperone
MSAAKPGEKATVFTTQLAVRGMTCDHCVRAVREELAALDGVTSVSVDLVPEGVSRVEVTSGRELDGEAVRGAVLEAGYEVAP